MEEWALFFEPGCSMPNLSVQKVTSLTASRMTWTRRGAKRWVSINYVQGLFSTFDAADEARKAARKAWAGDDGIGRTDPVAGRAAIKNANGYMPPPWSRDRVDETVS